MRAAWSTVSTVGGVGVQAQTRVLMRALQRLRIPTLVFVNKVDRRGADYPRVLGDRITRISRANLRDPR